MNKVDKAHMQIASLRLSIAAPQPLQAITRAHSGEECNESECISHIVGERMVDEQD